MNNILILSSSGKVNLVKSFKKHAYKYGSKIFTADMRDDAFTSYFSDEHFILPRDDDKGYFKSLLSLCIENEVGLIIPTRDMEIKNIATFRSVLKRNKITLLAPSSRTISTCLDKGKFCSFCKNSDIGYPETYSYSNIKFPCFAKEKFGSGSRNVKIIKSEEEMVENYEDYIFQEIVEWDEYSIDFFCNNKGKVLSLDIRKRSIVTDGESSKTEIEANEVIRKEILKITNKMAFFGHNVAQCFYRDGEVKMIEINTRFGGASGISLNKENNSVENLVNFVNGATMLPSKDLDDGLVMIKVVKDVIINEEYKDKTFCIDIDGTICTENPHIKYEYAKPVQKVIDKINKLFENGNTIKLHTARGAASGTDWKEITEKQLEEWGVKYHELIMGKPYADYYIDNKAVDILEWI